MQAVRRRHAGGSQDFVRAFACPEDLFLEFEEYAAELGCTVDALIVDAMKRMLEQRPLAPRRPGPPPVPPTRHPASAQHVSANRRAVSAPAPKPSPVRPMPPKASPQGRALRLHAATATGVVSAVVTDRVVIGRSSREADFVLPDGAVSRHHAVIERTDQGFTITDSGSTNGILVNGLLVRWSTVWPGDIVQIGPFTVTIDAV